MGRELRRVPPNWNHPRNERGNYKPMHDENFATRFAEWLADFDRIRRGELSDIERECYAGPIPLAEWLRDEGAPHDPDCYRPWSDDEATWFQAWETVSEGTPVTPPFATKEELVEYLVKHGDFWQEIRWKEGNRFMQPKPPGYSRAAAEAFVADGWAPSMVMTGDGRIASGIDAAELMKGDR